MADLWLVVGGPAVEFPANIFEPGKISEKILCSLSRKQQQETSGPRTDGGSTFDHDLFPPPLPPPP